MKKKITKNGTSATVTLSPTELKALGLRLGDEVDVTVEDSKVIIQAVNQYKRMTHEELLKALEEKFS